MCFSVVLNKFSFYLVIATKLLFSATVNNQSTIKWNYNTVAKVCKKFVNFNLKFAVLYQ